MGSWDTLIVSPPDGYSLVFFIKFHTFDVGDDAKMELAKNIGSVLLYSHVLFLPFSGIFTVFASVGCDWFKHSCVATFTAAPFFLFSRLIVLRLTLSVTRRLLWDVKKKRNLSHGSRCQQVTGSFYSETFMLLLLLLYVWSARLYEMCPPIFVCRLCGKWLFPAN